MPDPLAQIRARHAAYEHDLMADITGASLLALHEREKRLTRYQREAPADVEALLQLLARYGRHSPGCARGRYVNMECTCGWSACWRNSDEP